MNRQTLKRIPFFSFPEGGGWFASRVPEGEEDAGRIEIMFICPKCVKQGILTLHSIDGNGEVNASVLHSYMRAGVEGCGYHEFVTLGDWPKGWSKAAGEKYVTEKP